MVYLKPGFSGTQVVPEQQHKRRMPARDLTQRFVETLRTDLERLEIRDSKTEGLELRVTQKGTKSWMLRYRRRSDGRKRVITLGRFPELSLLGARQRAIEVRADVGRGSDPAGTRSAQKTAMTFAELAEKRLVEDVDIGEGTRRNYRQSLMADVYPSFGDVAAAQITPDMIARVLDIIERRGSLVHADRTRAAIGSTFKWAIKRRHGNIPVDPTAGLGKRAPRAARTRLLTDDELAKFWHAIHCDDAPLTPRMRLICQLAVLTGQRRTEIAGAMVAEVHMMGDTPRWVIPGDSKRNGVLVRGRTKNRKEQIVPLSDAACSRFRQAIELAAGSKYVFPADTVRVRAGEAPRTPHIHGESVSKAVRRLRAELGIEDITIHDLRRSISTWLGERGVRSEVIDLILNHQPRDITRRHYNLAVMFPLVRDALNSWANHIATLELNAS